MKQYQDSCPEVAADRLNGGKDDPEARMHSADCFMFLKDCSKDELVDLIFHLAEDYTRNSSWMENVEEALDEVLAVRYGNRHPETLL